MTSDGGIRASDHDRESAVEVLRDAYTAGRLNLDEFDERTTAAYAAKTWGDLRELTSDLPAEPTLGADLRMPAPKPLADVPLQYGSRRPPFIPLLPIALVWLVVAAAAHASAVVIPIVLLCLLSVRMAAGAAGTGRRTGIPARGPGRAGARTTSSSAAPRVIPRICWAVRENRTCGGHQP